MTNGSKVGTVVESLTAPPFGDPDAVYIGAIFKNADVQSAAEDAELTLVDGRVILYGTADAAPVRKSRTGATPWGAVIRGESQGVTLR